MYRSHTHVKPRNPESSQVSQGPSVLEHFDSDRTLLHSKKNNFQNDKILNDKMQKAAGVLALILSPRPEGFLSLRLPCKGSTSNSFTYIVSGLHNILARKRPLSPLEGSDCEARRLSPAQVHEAGQVTCLPQQGSP